MGSRWVHGAAHVRVVPSSLLLATRRLARRHLVGAPRTGRRLTSLWSNKAMSRETIQDKLCRGLEAEGHQRDLKARTSKYRVYIDAQNATRRFFVGKAGALRWGRIA